MRRRGGGGDEEEGMRRRGGGGEEEGRDRGINTQKYWHLLLIQREGGTMSVSLQSFCGSL